VASRLAIASAAAVAVFKGEAPALAKLAGTDISRMRSGTLAQAIRKGDTAIEKIVRDAAVWLGRGIATAVDMLAPDLIVLGGGLAEAMPNWYITEISRSIRDHAKPTFKKKFRFAKAMLGDDAIAIGAAAYAMQSAISGRKNA
jgi:glucokinase